MKARYFVPGLVVAVVVAFGLGWLARDRRDAAPQPSGSAVNGAIAPVPAFGSGAAPSRVPQISGVVEKVRVDSHASGQTVKFLVRTRRPPADRPVPTDFDRGCREGELVWINVRLPAQIEQRAGPVGVGAFVTAWHDGNQIETDPPQFYAEYLISEEAR